MTKFAIKTSYTSELDVQSILEIAKESAVAAVEIALRRYFSPLPQHKGRPCNEVIRRTQVTSNREINPEMITKFRVSKFFIVFIY